MRTPFHAGLRTCSGSCRNTRMEGLHNWGRELNLFSNFLTGVRGISSQQARGGIGANGGNC
jgi:hypothetical protein